MKVDKKIIHMTLAELIAQERQAKRAAATHRAAALACDKVAAKVSNRIIRVRERSTRNG